MIFFYMFFCTIFLTPSALPKILLFGLKGKRPLLCFLGWGIGLPLTTGGFFQGVKATSLQAHQVRSLEAAGINYPQEKEALLKQLSRWLGSPSTYHALPDLKSAIPNRNPEDAKKKEPINADKNNADKNDLTKKGKDPQKNMDQEKQEETTLLIMPYEHIERTSALVAPAFSLLKGKTFDAIVLISPCQKNLSGISVYWQKQRTPTDPLNKEKMHPSFPLLNSCPAQRQSIPWENPLDDQKPICIHEAAYALASALNTKDVESAHQHWGEKRLETALPFVHFLWPKTPIIPILINDSTSSEVLARTCHRLLRGKSVLYIGIANLGHFATPKDMITRDKHTMNLLSSLDNPYAVYHHLKDQEQLTDGAATLTTLAMLRQFLGLKPFQWVGYNQGPGLSQPWVPPAERHVVGLGAGISLGKKEAHQ